MLMSVIASIRLDLNQDRTLNAACEQMWQDRYPPMQPRYSPDFHLLAAAASSDLAKTCSKLDMTMATESGDNAQVGLMVKDVTVDNMLTGSPAYM